VTIISSLNFVPSDIQTDIQKLMDQSVDLDEQSNRLNQKTMIQTTKLKRLMDRSSLLLEQGERLCAWKPAPVIEW